MSFLTSIQNSNAYKQVNTFCQRADVKHVGKAFLYAAGTSFFINPTIKYAGTKGAVAACATSLFIGIKNRFVKKDLNFTERVVLKGFCCLTSLGLARTILGLNFNTQQEIARQLIAPLLWGNLNVDWYNTAIPSF